jgi:hypothetical protein
MSAVPGASDDEIVQEVLRIAKLGQQRVDSIVGVNVPHLEAQLVRSGDDIAQACVRTFCQRAAPDEVDAQGFLTLKGVRRYARILQQALDLAPQVLARIQPH